MDQMSHGPFGKDPMCANLLTCKAISGTFSILTIAINMHTPCLLGLLCITSMSEEVTYADLKFQDSSQTENIQKFVKFEKEDPPVPSHVWRQRALALTVLCLLLLIGLGVLGAIYLKTLKTGMEKLNKLQNFKEELQRNVSLQLMQNTNSSQKIRNLSIKLEEIATKLCRELYTKNKGHKCKPCPKDWRWHDDKCYFVRAYQGQETWQKSDEICSDYNASLLTIKSKSVLILLNINTVFWMRIQKTDKGNGNPCQYSCLDNSSGQRSLVGCSPWGHKKSDTTEHTQKTEASFSCFSRNKVNINFTENQRK
ncbi:C-type lectin domain family 12 member A isoform X2 [Bubalus bubalis]|uniref:C-type lectin domain family 12 member A isoform X2 n=1 Tax=Bubalus bubalis TaxID=89462 RepID=UPI001E1B919D|nr:C-type lectin domain family 12 member A isoform X2 [Bubalus bubalis]